MGVGENESQLEVQLKEQRLHQTGCRLGAARIIFRKIDSSLSIDVVSYSLVGVQ